MFFGFGFSLPALAMKPEKNEAAPPPPPPSGALDFSNPDQSGLAAVVFGDETS